MTMALGIITGTSVPLYINKVTKYSQERDGCHYLSILGITWPKLHVWSGFGKSATSFLFPEALILLDIVLNQWHQDANLSPREQGRWEDGQDERGKWSEVGQPPQITGAGGERISNNSACRKHLENKVLDEWVCSVGSSDEPVRDGLLSCSPVLPPHGKKRQPEENKKGCWCRACCSQGASQPSPPSAGDAKASRDVGKLQNGKRVGLTCALTGGCWCGERQTGHLKWEEAYVMGQGCIFGFFWLVLSWKRRQKSTMMSATHQVLPFGTCHRAVFHFLDCYYRQWPDVL